MRVLLCIFFAVCLISCNSSSKKDPGNSNTDSVSNNKKAGSDNVTLSSTPVKMAVADIPASITIKGKAMEAWKWNDKLGENILITSADAPHDEKDKDGEVAQSAAIRAYHYAKKEGDFEQIWFINDDVTSCPVDVTCEFIPGSATVTDLDKNGIAEIKVQYALACRGDVSPATMKLILYENGVKYALKGSRWLTYSPDFKYTVTEKDVNLESSPKLKDEMEEMLRTFGRYESEKEFVTAPPEFLPFARSEWLKYSKESIGD